MNPNKYFGIGKYFLPVFLLGVGVAWVFAALVVLFTGINELGPLLLLVSLPVSFVIARIVCPPRPQQQKRTEQDGEAGTGGGDDEATPQAPPPITHYKANTHRVPAALQEALYKVPVNAWTIGATVWILVLAAYVYFGYYWEGMPWWLAIFTLAVFPALRKQTYNLLGAGKTWRGGLVAVILVAEAMLYWYYMYKLPFLVSWGLYFLLAALTFLGARQLVVKESHVEPEPKKEGGDGQQDDAARKRKEIRESLRDK